MKTNQKKRKKSTLITIPSSSNKTYNSNTKPEKLSLKENNNKSDKKGKPEKTEKNNVIKTNRKDLNPESLDPKTSSETLIMKIKFK